MADEATVLIGYTNLDSRNLVMVANTYGLSTQHVALVRTGHEHDVVLNAKGQLSGVVHPGGNGQVGQSEQSASLTDISEEASLLLHEKTTGTITAMAAKRTIRFISFLTNITFSAHTPKPAAYFDLNHRIIIFVS